MVLMRKRDAYLSLDDDDEVVEDGQGVRVPLLLCDTVRFETSRPLNRLSDLDAADLSRHQPGYRLSDGEASKSGKLDARSTADARTAARDAYLEMVRRAESAWRQPVDQNGPGGPFWSHRDAAQPDNSSPEVMRAHLRGNEPDNVAEIKERAWAQYRDNLQNAWKTDPHAATAIQRQGERWRGGR
jgi:hypothetical protein